ncbi:MAG: hypothetical protein WA633_21715, partial [Stellaceae bacterium]
RGTLVPLGGGILATDDPLQFAGYIVRLLQDNKWRSELAAKSRAAAEKEYQWELHLEHLDRAIAEVTSPSPRLRKFSPLESTAHENANCR